MTTMTRPEAQDHVSEMARQFNSIAARFVTRADQRHADQATIEQVGMLIRSVDDLLLSLDGDERTSDAIYATAQAVRHAAFLLMTIINPGQAWFWTADWQAGEREVDSEIAEGNLTVFESDEAFDAALDVLDAQRA